MGRDKSIEAVSKTNVETLRTIQRLYGINAVIIIAALSIFDSI